MQHETKQPSSSKAGCHQGHDASSPVQRSDRELLAPPHSNVSSSRAAASGGCDWHEFREHQTARCSRTHDFASCCCKVVLLLGDIFRPYESKNTLAAAAMRWMAGVSLLLCGAALWLQCRRPQAYQRWRTALLTSHWVSVGVLVMLCLPLLAGSGSAAPAAAPAHGLLDKLFMVQLLKLLFRSGGLAPIMAAIMNRLRWQRVALSCTIFTAALAVLWTPHLCKHMLERPADTQLVNVLAEWLDVFAGQGQDIVGSRNASTTINTTRSSSSISSSRFGTDGHAHWQSMASRIAAACQPVLASRNFSGSCIGTATGTCMFDAGSKGGSCAAGSGFVPGLATARSCLPQGMPQDLFSDCMALQVGQCRAVVDTLNIFCGVLLVVFAAVLAERIHKWQFLVVVVGLGDLAQTCGGAVITAHWGVARQT